MVNMISVIGVTVGSFLLGWLWYGPLFGEQWKKLSKVKVQKKVNGSAYVVHFISQLVMIFILGVFLDFLQVGTATQGAILGVLVWLGFVATISLGGVLWEKKPLQLYFLNNLYNLLVLAVAGAVLAVF